MRDLNLNEQQETEAELLCKLMVDKSCIFTAKVFMCYPIMHEQFLDQGLPLPGAP